MTIAIAWVSCLCLAGCGERKDSQATAARQTKAAGVARERLVEGERCAHLLSAVAGAKQGSLKNDIKRLGLSDVTADLATRWDAQARREAADAGLSAEKIDKVIADTPAVVLDSDGLDRLADTVFSCAADVNGSHEH